MRASLLLIVLLLSGLAHADRLILAPLGKKIPYGTIRLEHLFDQAERDSYRTAMAVGVTESIDAELTYENRNDRRRVLSYDVSYNVLPPLTNFAPGISVGLRDGVGKSQDGRFAYLAATYRFGQLGRYSQDTSAEVTLGLSQGDRSSAFVGVLMPFRESFRMMVEHDTRRVSGGFEFRPHRDVWVRWIHRSDESLWSVTLVSRW